MTRFKFRPLAASLSLAFTSAVLADSFPADLDSVRFSGPDLTPSPATLAVSAQGEVYVGVDLHGSLGKGPGKGSIVKLIDTDGDGASDEHTLFAKIDNPRGIIPIGTKVYVLHTTYGPDELSTGMSLVVLEDADRDGIADGPPQTLVSGICSPTNINGRGTDHSTNGIRMGIDGWIYIAVGDFGFHDATGADGTQLTLLGGGIVRVRPDGTEMELYTTGTRNIYDIAIDPFLNAFTRGNTNDGGSWNVRILDHLQSGEYGYPRHFLNFPNEIIPALEDVGGGSGVGALFLSEPTWPDHYNNQPLLADWGRQAVYLHRLSPDGASFTQKAEEFIQVSQVTDLDVAPDGQMFVAAWDGAGFRGNDQKGYVVRVTPKNWEPWNVPEFANLSETPLIYLLKSPSSTIRFYAQQELLGRKLGTREIRTLTTLITDKSLTLESRVAALFTYAQVEDNPAEILAFAKDDALNEFALRAAADRLPKLAHTDLPLAPFIKALGSGTPRQQAAAAVALGRIGNPEAAIALLQTPYATPVEERARITEKYTIKGNRKAPLKLPVTPGEELRLHTQLTDAIEGRPTVMVHSASFVLRDGSKLQLSELTPKSGSLASTDQKPAGYTKKSAEEKTAIGQPLVVTGPAPVVFDVPTNAVAFEAQGAPTGDKNKSLSAEIWATTSAIGVPIDESTGPRHATPNSGILVPHLAAKALIELRAVDASLNAIGTAAEDLALWSLSYLHEESAVDGLLAKLAESTSPAQREKLLTTLARLYHQEAPYDGTWWWTTRPDTRGPYYKPVTWAASEKIAQALELEVLDTSPEKLEFMARLNDSHRLGIDKLGTRIVEENLEALPTVDLAKIASRKGAVATTPIEDIVLAMDKLKPNHELGEKLFTQQGCVACHALTTGGPVLGPYMGQIGSIMNTDQLVTAILRPNDTISQGFQSVVLTMNDDSTKMGFVSESTADKMVLRDTAGGVTTIATKDIKNETHLPTSMMPAGLANALSLDELAALVHFLASRK
ncbi:MAG: c-type cytochrome [Opitutaceae bacterium]|nr:c-type cytochrome [Opitutaceae bacterium]